jgi:hypothetical protein
LLNFRPIVRRTAIAASLASSFALAGCGGDDAYFKINGQVVSRDEYVRKLERQQLNLPNGMSVGVQAYVLDQLVSNRVMLAEAAKMGVSPTEEQINQLYNAQKDLYENRNPSKTYGEYLASQGVTPEEIREDMRGQLAEANVYAKLMNINEDEVRKEYEQAKDSMGLPPRTQMRMILAPPKSPLVDKIAAAVKEAAGDAKKFETAAADLNGIPQLKSVRGLQVVPNAQIPPAVSDKVLQAAEGSVVGPIAWPVGPGQNLTAWVRIERKLPAFQLPAEQGIAATRFAMVQQRAVLPENAQYRNRIMKQKLDSQFDSSSDEVKTVWKGILDQAKEAGMGQEADSAAAPAGAPAAPQPGK